jgi:hypothetical protein
MGTPSNARAASLMASRPNTNHQAARPECDSGRAGTTEEAPTDEHDTGAVMDEQQGVRAAEQGCSECFDWHRNPLNPHMVTEDNPTCPALRGHPRCVRFPLTESRR